MGRKIRRNAKAVTKFVEHVASPVCARGWVCVYVCHSHARHGEENRVFTPMEPDITLSINYLIHMT